MKKLLLIVGSLTFSVFSFAQSNKAGTIHVSVGSGATLGSADITSTVTPTTGNPMEFKLNGVGANANYSLRGSYGLNDNISAGIYLRSEGAAYVATSTTVGALGSTAISTSGVGFGVEAKYYAMNKDKWNWYVGPAIGFSTSTATVTLSTGSASGLNYTIFTGANYYFLDFLGVYFELGWNGSLLAGDMDVPAGATYKQDFNVNHSGVCWGGGVALKFGGN